MWKYSVNITFMHRKIKKNILCFTLLRYLLYCEPELSPRYACLLKCLCEFEFLSQRAHTLPVLIDTVWLNDSTGGCTNLHHPPYDVIHLCFSPTSAAVCISTDLDLSTLPMKNVPIIVLTRISHYRHESEVFLSRFHNDYYFPFESVLPTLNIHWKDWCWSWSSNILATWYEEPIHWKRPWCWERLRGGGEGDDRGWDSWVASLTQWTWVWVNFGR